MLRGKQTFSSPVLLFFLHDQSDNTLRIAQIQQRAACNDRFLILFQTDVARTVGSVRGHIRHIEHLVLSVKGNGAVLAAD